MPGFRKGRAPLKRVKEHFIKDVRARARARLVESIQETVGEQVGKQYRILGSPVAASSYQLLASRRRRAALVTLHWRVKHGLLGRF